MTSLSFHDINRAFQNHTPALLNMTQTLRAAILLPLIKKGGELHLLFEVRSSTLKRQPGDISFPGGKIDPQDESPWKTAQREGCEELGLQEGQISFLCQLDTLVAPFGVNLYCFLSEIHESIFENINPYEVDEVFSIPLSWFFQHPPQVFSGTIAYIPDEGFPYHKISGGKSYQFSKPPYPSYFYEYENHVIWGMTAFVLHHFIAYLEQYLSKLNPL